MSCLWHCTAQWYFPTGCWQMKGKCNRVLHHTSLYMFASFRGAQLVKSKMEGCKSKSGFLASCRKEMTYLVFLHSRGNAQSRIASRLQPHPQFSFLFQHHYYKLLQQETFYPQHLPHQTYLELQLLSWPFLAIAHPPTPPWPHFFSPHLAVIST